MDLFCEVCDRSIIENESECIKNIAALKKQHDKSIYEIYTIINPNLVELDKILNDFISSHNKKLSIYFINCKLFLVFDDNFKIYIETNYCHDIDDEFTKIKSHLLYGIEYYKLQG